MQILKANPGSYRIKEHFRLKTGLKGLAGQYAPGALRALKRPGRLTSRRITMRPENRMLSVKVC